MGLQGLFCTNFSSPRRGAEPCCQVWCPECYRPDPLDRFHIAEPQDKSGYARVRPGDKARFKVARKGDNLMTTFVCDRDIFHTLMGRWPPSLGLRTDKDRLLLCAIQRINLDALWSREPGTVYSQFLNTRENFWLWELTGVLPERVLPPLGPFPNRDILGWAVAINMILKTLRPGRYTDYTQFDTVRKLCSAYANLFNLSLRGAEAHVYLGRELRSALLTKCPTQTDWFEKFALGCIKRMRQVVKSNMALSMEVMLELLPRVEAAAREARGWSRMLHLMLGAALVIGMGGSLRGHEIFYADLFGMRKHLSKSQRATNAVTSHVFLALLGRFKGETGE